MDVTSQKKNKNWGTKKCATSPYWADELLGAIVMKVGFSVMLGR
jgi:hypothetical protein